MFHSFSLHIIYSLAFRPLTFVFKNFIWQIDSFHWIVIYAGQLDVGWWCLSFSILLDFSLEIYILLLLLFLSYLREKPTNFLKLITNYAWKRTFCEFYHFKNSAAVCIDVRIKNSYSFQFEIQKWILIWKLYSFLWSRNGCVVFVCFSRFLASAL